MEVEVISKELTGVDRFRHVRWWRRWWRWNISGDELLGMEIDAAIAVEWIRYETLVARAHLRVIAVHAETALFRVLTR